MMKKKKPASARSHLKPAESGVSLVELAIVVPVILLLLVAVMEFGLYFYTYTTLDKATRVAARYITSQTYDPGNAADPTNSIPQAKNLAVCGKMTACAASEQIFSDFTTSNVGITANGADSFFPNTVTVQITGYNYHPLFDLSVLTGGASWQNVPVNPSTTMRF